MSVLPQLADATPLGRLLRSREAFDRPEFPLLTVISATGVSERDLAEGRAPSEDLSGYRVVEPGDLVVNKLWARFGAYGVAPLRGIISPAYWVLAVDRRKIEPRFLHHLLRSDLYKAEIGRISRNLPPNGFDLSWEAFRAMPVALPRVDVQRRIADFLDDQVVRLSRAIKLTRRQLGVLEEAQQGLVEASVLGLSESGPRAPSFVSWIGAVPAAWSVQPVGRTFDVQLGKMLAPDRIGGAHQRPYLRNRNVQWDHVDTTDLKVMDFPPAERTRYAVHPGDLLVCEGGDIGRAAIWDGSISEIYYQKALHRVRARSSTSVRWLLYVLRAATRLGVFSAEGGLSTIAHLTAEQLRAHRIPIPTIEAEIRLIHQLDRRGRETRQAMGLLRSRLDLLQERKQALITAAVTGQFDVTTARAVA